MGGGTHVERVKMGSGVRGGGEKLFEKGGTQGSIGLPDRGRRRGGKRLCIVGGVEKDTYLTDEGRIHLSKGRGVHLKGGDLFLGRDGSD